MTDIAPPQPSVAELVERLATLSRSNRKPTALAMSPETWERLWKEVWPGHPQPQDRTFMNLPVQLFEGCLGVGIAFEEAVVSGDAR